MGTELGGSEPPPVDRTGPKITGGGGGDSCSGPGSGGGICSGPTDAAEVARNDGCHGGAVAAMGGAAGCGP